MTHICIAIPTLGRVHYLRGLLHELRALVRPAGNWRVEVVVFDNDPAASAQATVIDAQQTFPFPLHYEVVSESGLSSVRNAILAYAIDHVEFLAMLDDDEIPAPRWLCELVRVARATDADAVVGPVIAMLPCDAPQWFCQFRNREYPRFADGVLLSDGWTSNCLLRLSAVTATGIRFDPALNYSGGEDQLFFRELLARGRRIAYAADAIVHEIVPASRRSLLFVLKRSFRRGNSLATCDRRLKGLRGRMTRVGKALAIIALGLLRLAPFAIAGEVTAAVTALTEISRAAGMLSGLVGLSYQAYRRI